MLSSGRRPVKRVTKPATKLMAPGSFFHKILTLGEGASAPEPPWPQLKFEARKV
jgi:hypothetical protein